MMVLGLIALTLAIVVMVMAVLRLLPEDTISADRLQSSARQERQRVVRARVRAQADIDRLTHEALDAMLTETQRAQFDDEGYS